MKLFKFFRRKKASKFNNSYYQFILDRDKEHNKMMQELEDRKLIRECRQAAIHRIYCADIIIDPIIAGGIYNIYDDDTAKYKGTSLSELIESEQQKIYAENPGLEEKIQQLRIDRYKILLNGLV
jgi:hypothetical protein